LLIELWVALPQRPSQRKPSEEIFGDLRHAARPGPRHRYHFRRLTAAPRAAHPTVTDRAQQKTVRVITVALSASGVHKQCVCGRTRRAMSARTVIEHLVSSGRADCSDSSNDRDLRHVRLCESDLYPAKIPGTLHQHRCRQFRGVYRRLVGHPCIDPPGIRTTRYQESLRPFAQEENCRSYAAALARMATGVVRGLSRHGSNALLVQSPQVRCALEWIAVQRRC